MQENNNKLDNLKKVMQSIELERLYKTEKKHTMILSLVTFLTGGIEYMNYQSYAEGIFNPFPDPGMKILFVTGGILFVALLFFTGVTAACMMDMKMLAEEGLGFIYKDLAEESVASKEFHSACSYIRKIAWVLKKESNKDTATEIIQKLDAFVTWKIRATR